MSNAKHDNNDRPTVIGTLQSDGLTIVRMKVNPAGGIKISDGTSGTNLATNLAQIDGNGVSAWTGVSSVDGVTIVPIAFDSSGNMLTQST